MKPTRIPPNVNVRRTRTSLKPDKFDNSGAEARTPNAEFSLGAVRIQNRASALPSEGIRCLRMAPTAQLG
jgi:hypothetical protein